MCWTFVTQTSGNPGQRQGLQLNPEPTASSSARDRVQRRTVRKDNLAGSVAEDTSHHVKTQMSPQCQAVQLSPRNQRSRLKCPPWSQNCRCESWLCHFRAGSSVDSLITFACQMQVVPSSKGFSTEMEGMSSIASGGLVA